MVPRTESAYTVLPSMTFDFVQTRELSKIYGPTRALSNVTLRLLSGQVTAVEGPNGSGKSTLLSLLGLWARPSKGALWFGDKLAARTPSLRAAIGVLGHAAMLYPDLSAHENLQLWARLHGVRDVEMRLAALRERFGLGAWAERPARTYSRGQLQRAALARAVLHSPRLLLLDEPSTGLDAASVSRLVEAVRAERARGAIVVLVTHDAQLSQQLADRRVQLAHGRVVETAA
jgi:ABC-type multidrug transport system ATPase subunit